MLTPRMPEDRHARSRKIERKEAGGEAEKGGAGYWAVRRRIRSAWGTKVTVMALLAAIAALPLPLPLSLTLAWALGTARHMRPRFGIDRVGLVQP